VISHYSPFFRAAFENQFIEGQTQKMRLEDVESETFGKLVYWLYTQQIDEGELLNSITGLPRDTPTLILRAGSTGSVTPSVSTTVVTAFPQVIDLIAMAKLWTLAERCLIPALQNQVIVLLYRSAMLGGPKLTGRFVRYVYDEALESRILKRLAVSQIVLIAAHAPDLMQRGAVSCHMPVLLMS
jgi:hypothetical protein